MVGVIDVAAYVLGQCGFLTTMKLQKLVYYSQVRHIFCYGTPMFPEEFQAWTNGPVSPVLYRKHAGRFMLRKGDLDKFGSANVLSDRELKTVDFVLSKLGNLTGEELRKLSHGERPWQDARCGCNPSDRCGVVISIESIKSFYIDLNCSDNPVVCD